MEVANYTLINDRYSITNDSYTIINDRDGPILYTIPENYSTLGLLISTIFLSVGGFIVAVISAIGKLKSIKSTNNETIETKV